MENTMISNISKNVGIEEDDVRHIIDEFLLQIHRGLFEYTGTNGDYLGEELNWQIGPQAFYHLLGFLDTFSDRYAWTRGTANEYLLRLGNRAHWAPFMHQTEAWISADHEPSGSGEK